MNVRVADASTPPMNASVVALLWQAVGSPTPVETDGQAIRPRQGATHCAMTGLPAQYAWADAFSINFIPVSASNTLTPYRDGSRVKVGRGEQIALSAAAVWAAKTLALRCAPWAYEGGAIEFFPSRRYPAERREELTAFYRVEDPPDTLTWILRDRVPPAIIGLPLTGIAHGGEGCLPRCAWPTWPRHANPLIKLQSQQTAIYAQASSHHEQAIVQIDNVMSLHLDLPAWREAYAAARLALTEAAADGCSGGSVRTALAAGMVPAHASIRLAARWPEITAPLRKFLTHPFFPIFTDMLR